MSQLSSDPIFNNQLMGSADILKRAMTVTKLTEMLDCIQNLKIHAKTIEQDLPNYSNENTEINIDDNLHRENLLELAKQRSQNDRYTLLNESITFSTKTRQSTIRNHRQIEFMKCIIAAQPSALDAIYLESLLNPDQWQYDNEYFQTKPKDYLTKFERRRLNEILNESRTNEAKKDYTVELTKERKCID